MSSASSAVTYTSVYTDSESERVFWGTNEELSDGGSPRVIVYGYDGLPMLPVTPPSPDYIPVPEEPQTPPASQDEDEHEPMFIQPHDPDFMTESIYLKYIPLKDEHILPAEEQPLPPIVSPTAESPGYVVESDLEEDLEEYEDDETEDGPVDYPMDGGDDDDGDLSGDDGTKPVILPTSTDTATTGDRITVQLQAAIAFPPEAEVKRLIAMPTPSPSPLASLSPPYIEEHLASCTASAALPSPPLPPPLHMLPPVDHKDDIPETEMPPRKRLCLSTLGSREFRYGIWDTWIDPAKTVPEIAPMTVGETEIAKLQETDRRRQAQMAETLRVMGDIRREMGDMQVELLALREQPRRARQPGGDARVKFATCTLLYAALTWWNSQIRSLGPDAYSMTWEVLKKKITYKICPQGEIKKLEIKLWNLKKLRTYAERQSNNKRKADESFRNYHGHQQQTFKRRNVARVYNMGTCERKPYSGNFPKSSSNENIANAQRNNGENPKGNGCSKCGATGHFKRDDPKLKNKDGEKKRRNASRDPDSNVVTGTFLLNNRYASILFDTGADRSFISTAFSSLIDIVPTPLGNSYDVELADGKIVRTVIVCDEKLVQIPYGNETLNFCGNESNNGRESRLTVISCLNAQEYIGKGCQVFLAQIFAKKDEDRSEGKQLEDVPVVQDYPEVFLKDFLGLPPARPVEFQIDLIRGVAPVA
nr:hypothetical protein [Tanacetum cinerariifolium]